jgi:hypothetical protein
VTGDFPACAPHAEHGTCYQGAVEIFVTKLRTRGRDLTGDDVTDTWLLLARYCPTQE